MEQRGVRRLSCRASILGMLTLASLSLPVLASPARADGFRIGAAAGYAHLSRNYAEGEGGGAFELAVGYGFELGPGAVLIPELALDYHSTGYTETRFSAAETDSDSHVDVGSMLFLAGCRLKILSGLVRPFFAFHLGIGDTSYGRKLHPENHPSYYEEYSHQDLVLDGGGGVDITLTELFGFGAEVRYAILSGGLAPGASGHEGARILWLGGHVELAF